MTDSEKMLVQEGIRLGGSFNLTESQYIDDANRWHSFIYVYEGVYAKNDRLLWNIPDDSSLCKVTVAKEDDFYYLLYRHYNGELQCVAFTHKQYAQSTDRDCVNAWWN